MRWAANDCTSIDELLATLSFLSGSRIATSGCLIDLVYFGSSEIEEKDQKLCELQRAVSASDNIVPVARAQRRVVVPLPQPTPTITPATPPRQRRPLAVIDQPVVMPLKMTSKLFVPETAQVSTNSLFLDFDETQGVESTIPCHLRLVFQLVIVNRCPLLWKTAMTAR